MDRTRSFGAATDAVDPDGADVAWFVYLLMCCGDRLYVGVTPDLAARMRKHRAGTGAKFTRAHPPQDLLAAKPFPTRGQAQAMEHQVKRMRAAAKRDLAVTWSREFAIAAAVRAVFATREDESNDATSGNSHASERARASAETAPQGSTR